MARKPQVIRVALLALCLVLLTPLAAFAQAGSPLGGATPVEQPVSTPANQSPAGVPAAGAQATPVPANPAQQPAAGPNAQAPAAGPVGGAATPIGGNVPVQKPEPVSLFAYLLIVLAGLWFIGALAGIFRLLARPARGPFAVPLPPTERDRQFLTFVMPFAALITVAIIVAAWGLLFLFLAGKSELYPLAVDLLIICMVMGIATFMALRSGGREQPAIE